MKEQKSNGREVKKVVIIGAGFGGLNVTKALKHAAVDVLLIDRTNHHLFQPLLYQVATAALGIENIASPIREVLRNQSNVEVLMEEIEKIQKSEKKIYSKSGDIFSYDYLVVAPGSNHSYFGHDAWEADAPGLKTLEDAVRIRENILFAFEKAERSEDPKQAQQLLEFAIIGGGPTGVEMAGSLAECVHHTLFKNFRRINPAISKIYLIEATSQLLPGYPLRLAWKAQEDLKKLGVDVLLNTRVTNVTPEGIQTEDRFLPVQTMIWAAGNRASALLNTLETPLDKEGRVIVAPDLTVPGFPEIFVIGDAAHFKNSEGNPLPALAPVAIQQARYVAHVIKKDLSLTQRKPFVYFDKGMMATIGRGKAVALIRRLQISGLMAWLLWCVIHISYLISFRYRLLVMIQWMFLYLFWRRQGRVLMRPLD